MARTDPPTAALIVTEALTAANNSTAPSATEITRATDYGLEKVKRDLMQLGKKWRPLIKTDYAITIAGDADYANPSDFEAYRKVRLMSGTHTDTLSAVGSASSVTLKADEDATKVQVDGKWLLITSGTGVNQAKQIKSYVFATKVATMAEAYSTAPITGDGYLLVNNMKGITEYTRGIFESLAWDWYPGTPARFTVIEDATVGFMRLHPVPNAVFGLERTYYADLMKIGLTEGATALYSSILRRWAGLFTQGVYVWALGEDDDRYPRENEIYQSMLVQTATDDLVGFMGVQPAQQKG